MSQRRLAYHNINADKEKIPLYQGYERLKGKDKRINEADHLVKDYNIERIKQTNEARNKSILAHGFRLIRADEEYTTFLNVVTELLDRFYKVEEVEEKIGRSLIEWQQDFMFVTLE